MDMKHAMTNAGISRRGLLKAGAAVLAVAALPGKVWAAMTRPEAAFTATGVADTFAEIGGEPADSADIVLESPDIAENGAVVPVGVVSNIPNTTRIMIMVEKNPNPLSAIFMVPEGTSAEVQTRVKVAQTCLIYGVVEADGKFYKAAKETKVTLGGCGG
jgi:sulfur-oxidizing protein SoxY